MTTVETKKDEMYVLGIDLETDESCNLYCASRAGCALRDSAGASSANYRISFTS